MSLSTKLLLKQTTQLVMTPQLQQSIRLLQISNQELVQFVEAEIKSNPLLEIEEQTPLEHPHQGSKPEESLEDKNSSAADEAYRPLDFENAPTYDAQVLPEDVNPLSSEEHLLNGKLLSHGNSPQFKTKNLGTQFELEENDVENFTKPETTLKEHLSQQMFFVLKEPQERLIASHLIDLVDEAGYLNEDLNDIESKLAAPQGLVFNVLKVLQTLEPSGVFARSLAECLTLQLKEQNRFDPLMACLLDNLPLVAKHNIELLSHKLGVEEEETLEMIDEIKKLNPKPGLAFGGAPLQPVIPDILVRKSSDGGWIVELNGETLPRVLLNETYYAKVLKTKHTPEEKEFLNSCLQNANWLVKSLDQRARTILKVAQEIVRQQDAFLMSGLQHLRPMNLKTIADSISMHESTISRVTSNKYMATPRGIFELKYFFTSALSSFSDEAEAHSSKAVQFRIKQLIEAEASSSVLSDDMIVEHLKNDGVDIARRTVAKYRETMQIPSSVERRRSKKFQERTSHPV